MNDLPLNGRNFTQLLTITPGTVNINTDQNSGGGGGWNGASIGQFSFPAVNGARNRSNYFHSRRRERSEHAVGIYNYAPIVDAIQEFKSQGHNDLAEYGGAAGGIVSVVTKSGTNQYHGALWEFLRNEVMDSRGYFEAARAPLRQNQYGASVGGPLSIPKLYNGKNRTFFYAAWEGYRYPLCKTKPERWRQRPRCARRLQRPGRTHLRSGDNDSQQRPVHARNLHPGVQRAATRLLQRRHQLHPKQPVQSDLDAISCRSSRRAARPLVNGTTSLLSPNTDATQDSGTLRVDQNFGNNNQVSFATASSICTRQIRRTSIGSASCMSPAITTSGTGRTNISPTTFSDVYFGRNYGFTTTGTSWAGETPAFLAQLQQAGMSTYWMTLNNTTVCAAVYGG